MLTWRKSSRSQSNAGQCVEVARIPEGIAIRDSKNKTGPLLLCDRAAWTGFTASIETFTHVSG